MEWAEGEALDAGPIDANVRYGVTNYPVWAVSARAGEAGLGRMGAGRRSTRTDLLPWPLRHCK